MNKKERKFLPSDFTISDWASLQGFYQSLVDRKLNSVEDLRRWFQDRSELESVVSENLAWRYIRMTCDTQNQEYVQSYQYFIENIQPELAPYSDQLNRLALAAKDLSSLEKVDGYEILIRNTKNETEIFREENIPLFTEISTLSQQYGQTVAAMTVEVNGKTMTLQQAAVFLLEPDRELREKVYHQIATRRLADQDKLSDLYSQLIKLRNQVALNAGFNNFRDYMFKALARFDYNQNDCFAFHQSVEAEVVPLLSLAAQKRKEDLQLAKLRPWDKAVDPKNRKPLKAFASGAELCAKGIEVFKRIDPFLGDCLQTMKEIGHLDLESKPGKAPGGYNYPLAETGVPFIFMNATSTLRDLVTFMHEGGHAVHSFLTKDLELQDFKSTPSETAELASMSMELISMDHWDVFFTDPEELQRAKREHLEGLIDTLPWVALIDKFQHWIYENPNHSAEERNQRWDKMLSQFSDTVTDWSGLSANRLALWQKQLHLFEVPFYYIEYGMAQLGAIAVWKNYRANPQAGLQAYQNALSLGGTKSIPEVYQAAGIRFDFSQEYIASLMKFVRAELEKL